MRRHFHIARRTLAYGIAGSVVLLAIALVAASQALPMVARNPERISTWLSERVGQPVAFDHVTTDWTRRGPVLALDNLRIGQGARAFAVGDAEMLVSMYSGLLPGGAFSELRVRNLDLTLERMDDGRWRARGLPGQASGDPFEALERLGELHVIGARLTVDAPALGIDAVIPRADVRLRVSGDRVRAGVRAWAQRETAPLDAVLDFDRERGDGRVYAGSTRADLAAWAPWLRVAGVGIASGRGRAQGWATLRDHRVTRIDVATDLREVQLQRLAARDERVGFQRIAGRGRWQVVAGGWRVDAPSLQITQGTRAQVLDGITVAGGARYALLAERVDAGPLFAVAALSDRIDPAARTWLRDAAPVGTLHDVSISGARGGAVSAHGRITDAGFTAIGEAPAVRGIDATFEGDADAVSLAFDRNVAGAFEWVPAFRQDHPLQLGGTLTAWRHGAGWRVGTDALRVDIGGAGVRARGAVTFQNDGTRPHLDLAATVDDAALPLAKRFWVRHRMPASAVKWLDDALLAGRVTQGRAIVSGDLDDWPFDGPTGRFEATARLVDATVKFQPNWPAVQGLNADARFVANGFDVEGTARIAGIGIRHVQAGIDRYTGGTLTVQAQGAGDAAQLRQLLRDSPVYALQRDTLDHLAARGAADVDFNLALPLKPGSQTQIEGHLDLANAQLADDRWDLAFDQVSGRTRYTRSGFDADGLRVRQDGQPGRLSLRAGEFVREAGHAFEAGLDANVATRTLLARAPDLAWLRPYVDGRSAWTIGVAIPKAAAGVPTIAQLQLRSNLVGTVLDLPAPLQKPASQALAASVDTPLPLGSGEVQVVLGSTLALRARGVNGRTGVRVALGGARADAPPVSGLVATGRTPVLDALGWIGVIRGRTTPAPSTTSSNAATATPFTLQRVDVTAQRLQLLGGTFRDTRLVVVPAANDATAVRIDGPALAGAVLVPASNAQAIAGRFERVHWAGLATAPAAATQVDVAPARVSLTASPVARAFDPAFDPADIPPLNFDIDDLRFGAASLGSAKVRTRPVTGGLQVEQMQARTRQQTLSLTGDWLGRGPAARTRMTLDVDSRDIGALLDGFGLRGRVDGGTGTMKFAATWPGSPADFKVANVEGTLALDARNGRLLEVEPGAGRVLGLLSIAELPRRLTLDFRDFFNKGFAFNRIDGGVRFGGGVARTDTMKIDGPAAAIDIRGTANLRAQSFDQTVEVRPRSGSLLAVAGAVAGGPVGAAIGAAAGAVLRKPLGQIGAKTYRVTGPWKEPKVEVVSRDQSRVVRAGAPAG